MCSLSTSMTRPSALRSMSTVFDLGHPFLAGDFVDGVQPVRRGLVRAEQPEILLAEIELHHVAQKRSENPRRFRLDAAGLGTATA